MKNISLSTLSFILPVLTIAALSSSAQAGYKDQAQYQGQACNQCDQVEQHVNVQVIHKPRPGMLRIPNMGPRKRVHVYYHHNYQRGHTPNVQIIDRHTPLTQKHHRRVEQYHHQRAEMILPQIRPLSALRNGIASGVSRLLGRH